MKDQGATLIGGSPPGKANGENVPIKPDIRLTIDIVDERPLRLGVCILNVLRGNVDRVSQ